MIPLEKDKNNSKYIKRVYQLSLLGLTDREIAIAFGINQTTLDYWKANRPGFHDALIKGKQEADSNVAKSLYQRAVGYKHNETKVFIHQGEIITEDVMKHYPPDTSAAIFWLKNRTRHLPNPWSDVTKHEVTGKDGVPLSKSNKIDYSDFTDEELEMMARMSIKIKKQEAEETDESKARNKSPRPKPKRKE